MTRLPWWFADYGTPEQPVLIDGVMSAECPASLITPESIATLEIVNRNRHVREASGCSIFGSDVSRWPAKFVDALELIEIERIRVDNARAEAEESRIRRATRGKSES